MRTGWWIDFRNISLRSTDAKSDESDNSSELSDSSEFSDSSDFGDYDFIDFNF